MVIISGMMAKNILDNGMKMTCMDQVFINIKMEILMKGCMKMIKKRDMEFTNGLTDEFTEDTGIKESNMDLEFLKIHLKIN